MRVIEAALETDHDRNIRVPDRVLTGRDPFHIKINGLFAKNMLAGPRRINNDLCVGRTVRTDCNSVNIPSIQQFMLTANHIASSARRRTVLGGRLIQVNHG